MNPYQQATTYKPQSPPEFCWDPLDITWEQKAETKHAAGHFLFFKNSIKSCHYHHSKRCFLHMTMQQITCESCENTGFGSWNLGLGAEILHFSHVSQWVMRDEGTGIICQEESFTVNGFYTWEENTMSEPKIQPNSQKSIIHGVYFVRPMTVSPPSRCTSRVKGEIPLLLSRHSWRVFRSCSHRRDICKIQLKAWLGVMTE